MSSDIARVEAELEALDSSTLVEEKRCETTNDALVLDGHVQETSTTPGGRVVVAGVLGGNNSNVVAVNTNQLRCGSEQVLVCVM